ncbi:MSHA biogenesis protein MshI [Photobacterium andalusiense]|uniref:MSHA biogenesis protein MshI n=1 Tax=Photobacterium andalusiense TaxID=2204296 RepID=A0A1Y6MJ68_9GAMM|nr:MSHA biogenesis protein MshI [Photobacterium andalusiense]SMY36606.1 hypothetical protein PAND9192_02791 [Photobacterium andalusiense]
MIQRLFSSFLAHKNPSLNGAITLYSDAVVVVVGSEADVIVDSVPITSTTEWSTVIEMLIAKHQLAGSQVAVILGQGLYQSLLIDKPELGADELALALPYLVKDLVNEAPEDIVADGFSCLQNDRLQVFVSTRQQVAKIIAACKSAGCDVGCVTVESVVWSEFTADNRSQLIVHRYGNGNLQLTAFSQHKLFFQRQLRGFDVSLVAMPNTDAQSLQLDSLALELQRSLDFVSAQLRDDSISQLLISCDNDDNHQLAQALNDRLNVTVKALVSPQPSLTSTAARVTWAGFKQGFDSAINLYSQHLQPKRQWLTLNNMLLSWLALTVLIATVSGCYSFKSRQLSPEIVSNNGQLTAAQTELALIQKQLLLHIVSPIKQQRVSVLEQEISAKQATLKAVANHDASLLVGYGEVLTQLAAAASTDIAIERISISAAGMNVNGSARIPDAVPRWLSTFNRYSTLAERRFQLLTIDRDDSNQVRFSLQAQRLQGIN